VTSLALLHQISFNLIDSLLTAFIGMFLLARVRAVDAATSSTQVLLPDV